MTRKGLLARRNAKATARRTSIWFVVRSRDCSSTTPSCRWIRAGDDLGSEVDRFAEGELLGVGCEIAQHPPARLAQARIVNSKPVPVRYRAGRAVPKLRAVVPAKYSRDSSKQQSLARP